MPGDNEIKAELDLGPPPPEVMEYAKREVNEDPETRCQVISELRDMIYGKWEKIVFFSLKIEAGGISISLI